MKILLINLLSFVAGYMNTLSLILFMMPISHITGTLTKFSVIKMRVDVYSTLFYFGVVICYTVGAIISGKCFKKGYHYLPIAFLIMALINIVLATLLYHFQMIVFILAMMMGFQNGIPLKINHVTVRTTHFTGTLTDIAVIIGKNGLNRSFMNKQFLWKSSTLCSFILGGLCVLLFVTQKQVAFLIVTILYILLSVCSKGLLKAENNYEKNN